MRFATRSGFPSGVRNLRTLKKLLLLPVFGERGGKVMTKMVARQREREQEEQQEEQEEEEEEEGEGQVHRQRLHR